MCFGLHELCRTLLSQMSSQRAIGHSCKCIFSMLTLLVLLASQLFSGYAFAEPIYAPSSHVQSELGVQASDDFGSYSEDIALPETFAEVFELEIDDDEVTHVSGETKHSFGAAPPLSQFLHANLHVAHQERKLFILFHCWRSHLLLF